jgi:hypothetical protein
LRYLGIFGEFEGWQLIFVIYIYLHLIK